MNEWYRAYSSKNNLANLVFQERQPFGWLRVIVKPDSADPGLGPSTSIVPLDEDHVSIIKLRSREDDLYKELAHFIRTGPTGPHADTLLADRLASLESTVSASIVPSRVAGGLSLLDEPLKDRLWRLRRGRHLAEFKLEAETRRLTEDLLSGELSQASPDAKCAALAWCARILSTLGSVEETEELLNKSRRLGNRPEVVIAEAFLLLAKGNRSEALAHIKDLNSPMSRSASFVIATRDQDAETALSRFDASGLSTNELDADGKLLVLLRLLETGRWQPALQLSDSLDAHDFEASPALLRPAAMTNVIHTLPEESKAPFLHYSPLFSNSYFMAGEPASLERRRAAQNLLERMATEAELFECPAIQLDAGDTALWLELNDPDHRDQARERVKAKLASPADSLHYVAIAGRLGIELNRAAVQRQIEREKALSGQDSSDAILAGLALAQLTEDPEQIAAHIDANRDDLIKVIVPAALDQLHIKALAHSDQVGRAERILETLVADGISAQLREELQSIIDEGKGADRITSREELLQSNPTLENLTSLVGALEQSGNWTRLKPYAQQLFEKTKAAEAAQVYLRSLAETYADKELVAFVESNQGIFGNSINALYALAWAHFRLGNLPAAQTNLATLRSLRDDPNDRLLLIQTAIISGEWETLLPFIEDEWNKREQRSPGELLRAGQLASQLKSPRSRDLVKAAAHKAASDPAILIGCYNAAVKGDWEDDAVVGEWLQTAIEKSGDDGPIRRVSLGDILDQQPQWEIKQSKTWGLYTAGDVPTFVVAEAMNRTTVDLTLVPMLANRQEPDLRRRSVLFAFSGKRGKAKWEAKRIGIEPNALLTLSFVDLLPKALDQFEHVVIPHSTMAWLFNEVQHVEFHQPSRVTRAKKIRELIENGQLKRFASALKVNFSAAQEVGEHLAALLTAASAQQEGSERQHLVIRPYPVHKVGSLMKEITDLPAYSSILCNCASVVSALRQRGRITAADERRALQHLSLHEGTWPTTIEIKDKAVLYLDELAVTYLDQVGMLGHLKNAGFVAFVDASEADEISALLSHQSLAADVLDVLDRLRQQMAAAIKTGKVQLAESVDASDDLKNHPTANVLRLTSEVDAVLIDDRFVNQHANLDHDGKRVPIATTVDLIDFLCDSKVITNDERTELRTRLRQASLCLIPIAGDELLDALKASEFRAGRVIENAELRAMSESIRRLQMSDVLQAPKEQQWLSGTFEAIAQCMRNVWLEDIAEETIIARSNWLVELYDIRPWMHRLPDPQNADLNKKRYRLQLLALIGVVPNRLPTDRRRRYCAWLDDQILADVQSKDQATFQWLVAHAKSVVDDLKKKLAAMEGDEHES
ncbi:hypothetical protein NKH24_29825 [Mesorhizobium sp. M1300]|uniref:HTH domain-containing protein n=1 Tax=Mesorhizobium sp. M1300 TaxID=2957077 RepID=UPI0033358867